MKLLVLLTALFAFGEVPRSMFDYGKHCVAYKVKKKSFSVFSSTVVGKNCDISVQLLPVVGGGYQIDVSVPINGFDSGDRDRDQDVRSILKESEQSDILFHSKVMSEKEWREAIKKPTLNLEGELVIAGKSYGISAPSTVGKVEAGVEIDGVATVPFSKFDLQPPKVGGGIIAKADSELELHFHLISDKILGADKVLGAVEVGELVPDLEIPKEKVKDASKKVVPESKKEEPLKKAIPEVKTDEPAKKVPEEPIKNPEDTSEKDKE